MERVANSRTIAQAETKRQLVASARELMLTEGYGAASVSAITQRAGFTTGAFYSNFDSKADVALVVLASLQGEAREHLSDLVGANADLAKVVENIRGWITHTLDSGWPRLELEFALANRADSSIVATEGARNRSAVDNIAEVLTKLLPSAILEMVPARRIAELILDLSFGLAVRKIVDPSVTPDHVLDLVDELLSAVTSV
ncbi:TetR/AcrR family transcriptional regulator [Gordonia sp. CPCC 205333]|uniref:TetR/AcrR family transcriptional regulator n=1 Tax=Gordonia sp. CPCC 205333 TaxID=3140790 RepID=UPI003AF34D8B